ncbi:hypothetical protein NM688_g6484 [Phlebia brevispora]|uniref:Uncharacterized protein n=1 Tax=Phlebia brevispora TaxID=194682 RepID=A0ACC1SFP6_9APHY|nr:hypothetical protein NM688_g6484 [Phlebia brevispora]
MPLFLTLSHDRTCFAVATLGQLSFIMARSKRVSKAPALAAEDDSAQGADLQAKSPTAGQKAAQARARHRLEDEENQRKDAERVLATGPRPSKTRAGDKIREWNAPSRKRTISQMGAESNRDQKQVQEVQQSKKARQSKTNAPKSKRVTRARHPRSLLNHEHDNQAEGSDDSPLAAAARKPLSPKAVIKNAGRTRYVFIPYQKLDAPNSPDDDLQPEDWPSDNERGDRRGYGSNYSGEDGDDNSFRPSEDSDGGNINKNLEVPQWVGKNSKKQRQPPTKAQSYGNYIEDEELDGLIPDVDDGMRTRRSSTTSVTSIRTASSAGPPPTTTMASDDEDYRRSLRARPDGDDTQSDASSELPSKIGGLPPGPIAGVHLPWSLSDDADRRDRKDVGRYDASEKGKSHRQMAAEAEVHKATGTLIVRVLALVKTAPAMKTMVIARTTTATTQNAVVRADAMKIITEMADTMKLTTGMQADVVKASIGRKVDSETVQILTGMKPDVPKTAIVSAVGVHTMKIVIWTAGIVKTMEIPMLMKVFSLLHVWSSSHTDCCFPHARDSGSSFEQPVLSKRAARELEYPECTRVEWTDRGKINIKDQTTLIQNILETFIRSCLNDFVLASGIPTADVRMQRQRELLIKAAESNDAMDIGDRIEEDRRYWAGLIAVGETQVGVIRGNLKKSANSFVASEYGLVPGSAGPRVAVLLASCQWIYAGDVLKKLEFGRPFDREIFPQLLVAHFFNGPNAIGSRLSVNFKSSLEGKPDEKEIPEAMLAVVSATVALSIADWTSGTFTAPKEYNTTLAERYFGDTMAEFGVMKKRSMTGYHRTMHGLWNRVNTMTGGVASSSVPGTRGQSMMVLEEVAIGCDVARTLAGCRKLYNTPPNRKRPLEESDIHILLHALSTPSGSSHDDLLFLSITLTGVFALMRLGELVWPDRVADRTSRKLILRNSVRFHDNGFRLFLPGHKADRFFEGNDVIVTSFLPSVNSTALFEHSGSPPEAPYPRARGFSHGSELFSPMTLPGTPYAPEGPLCSQSAASPTIASKRWEGGPQTPSVSTFANIPSSFKP